MKRLEDKTVFITGGASGLGRAQALRFAAEGAVVIVADINEQAAASVVAEIEAAGNKALVARIDIADRTDVERCIAPIIDKVGRIHILSNTAGIMDGRAPLLDTSHELWDRVLGVNLTGMFNTSKALIPHMLANGGGVVLNISSGAALRGGLGGAAYTSAKHGVIGFTRQLAADYGKQGIRAVGIAPGLIDTPMVARTMSDPAAVVRGAMRPAGRIGTPDDIANAALFLVSDESDFIHGVTLAVDGGRSEVA